MKEKTYNRYLKRIKRLMEMNPKAGSKHGKELLRLAVAVEKYEKSRFQFNHSKRKLRADLVEKRRV